MKKIFYSLLFFFCIVGVIHATDCRSRVLIAKHSYNKNIKERVKSEDSDDSESGPIKFYPIILEIPSDKNADEILTELGAIVYHNRGPLYLTSVPIENIDKLPRIAGIDNFQLSSKVTECLDVARTLSNVDKLHHETGILSVDKTVESKVVTGICDVGFDPRHAAFQNCLKRWTLYDEYKGIKEVYDGYDNIQQSAPETDNSALTHATHVANILVGKQQNSSYYGVAPQSDFVISTSQLTEVGICCGIEDIIEYSKEVGKRAVVNVSAGSYLGPHDGTDLIGKYLSAMSEDAIICFSAGNYGTSMICQSLDLDDFDSFIGSTWCGSSWTGFDVKGGTDFWGRDDKPFEFRIIIWDVNEKCYKYQSKWMGGNELAGEYFLDLGDTEWFTDGGLWLEWGINESNNRFNVAIEYDYKTEALQIAGPWARYAVAYHIRKIQDNTHVDVYADGIYSFLHGRGFGVENSEPGNADGSISNMACCPDVVAVGAWTTRSVVPDLNAGEKDWGNTINSVAPWSAYGSTVDKRNLPHFCAPGNTTVSAMSKPYFEFDGEKDGNFPVAVEIDGQRYFAECGTSMASPFAAGIFALWLEENPNLTRDELLEITIVTANKNFRDITNPRWGAGAIDAYAGWKEILERSGIENIKSEAINKPILTLFGGEIRVEWIGVSNPSIEIYDLTGRKLKNSNLNIGAPLIVKITDPGTGRSSAFKIM